MSEQHLLLTGYRGCGKSAVGQRLADLLNRPIVDIDLEIEASTGQSIAEIFDAVGEQGFRDLESSQISELASLSIPSIVSLGGGAILREENRNRIRSLGVCVWLQASPETIHERISKDKATQARRPKLSALGDLDEIRSILEMRLPWYNEVADLSIATDDRSLDEVAQSILHWFQSLT
jgi:shikimate kinase